MSKFIYTQDIHLKKKNPIRRIDDYFSSVMTKLEEVFKVYQKEKCDYLLDGGDLLETPIVSYGLIDDFVDLLEKYNVKMKLLYGNHSLIGANLDASSSTSLSHMLRRSKNLELLTEIETDTEFIKGYDYYFGIENDINDKGLFCEKKDKTKIAIVHALITERKFFDHIPHVVVDDLKTNYDYVLVAHNHHPWRPKKIGNTNVINIGCLGRRKIDEAKINPSYLIYETGKPFRVEKIKSAKSGEEIFDFKKYEEKKESKQTINDFVEMVNNVKFQQLDLMSIIQTLAKENNFEKNVTDCIVNRIGEIENE